MEPRWLDCVLIDSYCDCHSPSIVANTNVTGSQKVPLNVEQGHRRGSLRVAMPPVSSSVVVTPSSPTASSSKPLASDETVGVGTQFPDTVLLSFAVHVAQPADSPLSSSKGALAISKTVARTLSADLEGQDAPPLSHATSLNSGGVKQKRNSEERWQSDKPRQRRRVYASVQPALHARRPMHPRADQEGGDTETKQPKAKSTGAPSLVPADTPDVLWKATGPIEGVKVHQSLQEAMNDAWVSNEVGGMFNHGGGGNMRITQFHNSQRLV
ncbi:hypothetical protein R3P38DRAFT_2907055 [Favolaschia claudopus]|uniref:Uncharacterized protein n=1 Tax=Favolaschia claudopus TaxID=2862362 RepID=A0AAW0CD35_9AGAR